MVRMRTASNSIRFFAAALLALLLALRCLAPAGFMPAFDRGAVMIVACPDASTAPMMPMHGHGDHKGMHQPCPYASVSALGALGPDLAPLLAGILFSLLLLADGRFLLLERQERGKRPPATGPPIPA